MFVSFCFSLFRDSFVTDVFLQFERLSGVAGCIGFTRYLLKVSWSSFNLLLCTLICFSAGIWNLFIIKKSEIRYLLAIYEDPIVIFYLM